MTNPVVCAVCRDPARWAVFSEHPKLWFCADCWPRHRQYHIEDLVVLQSAVKEALPMVVPSWIQG